MLIITRVLPLVLVAFPLLASPVSLEVLLASQVLVVVVVSSLHPDTLTESLTIFKLLLPASLETSLLQLASPEALSSLLPVSTLVVPHLLDFSLPPEDRLCRRWITRVIQLVRKEATMSVTRLRMSYLFAKPQDHGCRKQMSIF